jgi:hypothetical protein
MMRTPLLLFAIALALRAGAALYWQFDGLYGQDAYAYFGQAVALADALPRGHLPPTNFFWPNGYPLLIAAWMPLLGRTPLAGQLASLLAGSLVAPLTFSLTQRLVESGKSGALNHNNLATRMSPGLLAGLIVAAAGQPILSSVVIMADMPALFWATLAAWLLVQPRPSTRTRYFLAGLALGLAVITRWVYAQSAPALLGYVSLTHRRAGLRNAAIVATGAGAAVLPQLWLSFNEPAGLAHSWLLGWRPLNFFLRQFNTIDGYANYSLPSGLFYAQPAGHPAYIFPLLGLAAAWGVWRLGRARQWPALALLIGWAGPVYLFLGGIPYQNFRFGLTLYPPLVILTALGLADWQQRRNFSPVLFKTLVGVSLAGMLAWAYPMLNTFLTAQNRDKIIARHVDETLPPQATVLTFGLTLTLQQYTHLDTRELFYLDNHALEAMTAAEPLYLLVNPDNLNRQWQGLRPQANFLWLQKNTRLEELGRFPPYTLFKIHRRGQP